MIGRPSRASAPPPGPTRTTTPSAATAAPSPPAMFGAANGVAVQADGKPLLGGQCGPDGLTQNTVEVYRFQADDDGSGDTITVDAVNADTSEAAARRLGLPIDGVDREEFATRVASLQSAPLKNTPLKNTPLKNTPLKNTPLKNTPAEEHAAQEHQHPDPAVRHPDRAGGWLGGHPRRHPVRRAAPAHRHHPAAPRRGAGTSRAGRPDPRRDRPGGHAAEEHQHHRHAARARAPVVAAGARRGRR